MSFSSTIPAIAFFFSYAYSPAKKRIAAGSYDGRVAVYEPAQQTPIWVASKSEWHPAEVYALAWSPDGSALASCGMGRTIKVWNTDGYLFQEWEAHSDTVIVDLAWSPDGRYLASVGSDGMVRVWAMGTNHEHEPISTYDHDCYVASVAWSPDGRQLASGNSLGDIVLSDPQTGVKLKAYIGSLATEPDNLEMNEINALAWSPNGMHLACSQTSVGGNIGIIQIFSIQQDTSIVYNSGCGWLPQRLTWANGHTVMAADMDGCIHQLRCSSDELVLEAEQRHCASIGEGMCFFNEETYITTFPA
ncbi:WD40 repeat domain-containing protein [Dictyobacter formicarum]|uniref:Anaphase-promoting complex subunit 4 WD40 domain-containing protein n=1 Tax=Dictyobacter formicarum TaxID=2778368 RepID=A0ABQ3VSW6_9CHLR|nr:hypothetical protein [Dictyobacter formicarum]GHO88216.1 hypothetical protein KSZ_62220 [Dictyobacter formicarum]